MNYPVWQLDFAGGGLLIAMIAIIHVYVAQFAVGGGLFLVLTESMGHRRQSQDIIGYVRVHARFFMLLTMVFGALTGVGIWFTISLLNPSATSVLVHTFVFAWAIEWLFFGLEIISLFIYYYTFGRLAARTHLLIGWIYFGSAWMSLFVINGIIDFMLTPGNWPATANFWDGFFNPTFWPALFFRTFLALMIAGLFGLFTSSLLQKADVRLIMVRFSAKWLLAPFALFLGSAWWYRASLPPQLAEMIFQKMPQLDPFIAAFAYCSPLLILGGLIMAIRLPAKVGRSVAAVMLFIGLLYLGTFEFIREGGRRPYIIHDYMYSTSIRVQEQAQVAQSGILSKAKWVEHREIHDKNQIEAGREVFNILCLSCHSIGGPLNDVQERTANISRREIDFIFSAMGKQLGYMPPFVGTDEEKQALVVFLASLRQKRSTLAERQ